MVLVVQVGSFVMCTPRILVLQRLFMVEQSMVKVRLNTVSPKVHHNLVCIAHIEGQMFLVQMCHSAFQIMHSSGCMHLEGLCKHHRQIIYCSKKKKRKTLNTLDLDE